MKDLNVRAKTVKLLQKTGEKLHDIALGNAFLDMTPKTMAEK